MHCLHGDARHFGHLNRFFYTYLLIHGLREPSNSSVYKVDDMASVCQGHFKVNAFVFHYHLVTCSQRTKAGGARATQYEKT